VRWVSARTAQASVTLSAVGRVRLLAVTFGILAALACLPSAAAAANFTWNLTSDFSTSPLTNPDKDSYGGHPWSYEKAGGAKLTVADKGLPGWRATPGGSPFVAITGTRDNVVLQPTTSAPAVVAWTSPVSGSVTVSGSVVANQTPGLLCPNATWSLAHGTTTLAAGSASPIPASFSKLVDVRAGERVVLSVTVPVLLPFATAGCTETGATLSITQIAPAPAVTLQTPANGATITGGQPTFAGAADTGFGASHTVTVRVFSGTGTTGIPVRTVPATVSSGIYSATPSPALPDGTYTAQAEQDSASGAQGFSTKNTFVLKTAGATITLNSPGATPLRTATPTLTGTAAHNQSVHLTVYPGDTTNATPVANASGASGGDGRFSIRLPALADGRYTVIATDGSGGISHPVTFRIKVHGPALTLTQPAAGGRLSQSGPVFFGAAGHSLGDAPQVSLTLFGGKSTHAKNLGTRRSSQTTGNWVVQWPKRLALGTYTVRVSQGDDAGHTTTVTHTFQVVPANSSVGATVDISPGGQASVPLWCTATVGQVCSGTVLILTKKTYRTAGGGLAGRLRVMFAYVTIPGGGTVVVRRKVQSDALHELRRARKVPAVVVATLRSASRAPRSVGVSRVITVRSARHR
jgi:hypothetical protein